MGALKYVVIGVVVVVVVAAALVTTTDTAPGACAVHGFIQRL
jgi:autotransporter translocation and assembly factor TamB